MKSGSGRLHGLPSGVILAHLVAARWKVKFLTTGSTEDTGESNPGSRHMLSANQYFTYAALVLRRSRKPSISK